MSAPIVVLGAGHAGVQLAASLREVGFDGEVVLVAGERALPYQRPLLSKSYLAAEQAALLPLRAATFFTDRGIDLRRGVSARSVDRTRRLVSLDDGGELPYEHLVFATGARARQLGLVPPGIAGVRSLREVADADAIRAELARATDVLVLGGGFLGLEAASVATTYGCRVRVVEAAGGLMSRAVSPAISDAFAAAHRQSGVEIVLGTGVQAFQQVGGRVVGVELTDGRRLPADLVLVSVGAVARTELAADCGLEVGAGVLVDEFLRTSDPAVSAIGDCAQWTIDGRSLHRESVQNAIDQARCVAARLAGAARPYRAVPWFWSEQTVGKLQIAGVREAGDAPVPRGDPGSGSFSIFHFAGRRLTCVESVGRAADHLAGRRLLEAGRSITPAEAGDPDTDLRALVADRLAAAA